MIVLNISVKNYLQKFHNVESRQNCRKYLQGRLLRMVLKRKYKITALWPVLRSKLL